MLFGQKAKNVKTTVNVNEVAYRTSGPATAEEFEKANKTISELQAKIKILES